MVRDSILGRSRRQGYWCDSVVRYYLTGELLLAPPHGSGAGGAESYIQGGRFRPASAAVTAADAGMVIGDAVHVGYVTETGVIHSSSSKQMVVEVPFAQVPYIWPEGYYIKDHGRGSKRRQQKWPPEAQPAQGPVGATPGVSAWVVSPPVSTVSPSSAPPPAGRLTVAPTSSAVLTPASPPVIPVMTATAKREANAPKVGSHNMPWGPDWTARAQRVLEGVAASSSIQQGLRPWTAQLPPTLDLTQALCRGLRGLEGQLSKDALEHWNYQWARGLGFMSQLQGHAVRQAQVFQGKAVRELPGLYRRGGEILPEPWKRKLQGLGLEKLFLHASEQR
eukprot:jgi/Mesvir1/2447/Mv25128-RA.1